MSRLLIKFLLLFIAVLVVVSPVDANTLPYDYTSVISVPIELSITEKVSTKGELLEGQELLFTVRRDVVYNNKPIVLAGDTVKAKVETIISSGMNGFPAEIIIDDFEIPNVPNSKMLSTYTKVGQNRCLLVYPLKWALTPIPFAGSLTNFIYGGHAVIKPKNKVVIYYFPEWK